MLSTIINSQLTCAIKLKSPWIRYQIIIKFKRPNVVIDTSWEQRVKDIVIQHLACDGEVLREAIITPLLAAVFLSVDFTFIA